MSQFKKALRKIFVFQTNSQIFSSMRVFQMRESTKIHHSSADVATKKTAIEIKMKFFHYKFSILQKVKENFSQKVCKFEVHCRSKPPISLTDLGFPIIETIQKLRQSSLEKLNVIRFAQ